MTFAPLRIRSFAKVNLALSVLGRRRDGYHDIQTIFQTIDLSDQLEFRTSPQLELRCENLPDINNEDNLVWKAAALADQGQRNSREAAIAKALAADVAMKVTTDAVQIYGGMGYTRWHPVEKLMRDAKVIQIYEGSAQIMRRIIARSLLTGDGTADR